MKQNKWHKKNKDEDDDNVLSNFFDQDMQEKQFLDKLVDSYIEIALWGLTAGFLVFGLTTEYSSVALLSIVSSWSAVLYRRYVINRGDY